MAVKWAQDMVGQTFGRLTVVERAEDSNSGLVRWLCRCACGTTKVRDGADLRRGRATSCGCAKPDRARAQGILNFSGSAAYSATHQRVRRHRGKASEHACSHCGTQASQWAYDHEDPTELIGENRPGHAVPYSLDPERYLPLCVSCHSRFDHAKAQERK